jgi:hypothetical protein
MGELKAQEKLSGPNIVTLVFIPGHGGIPGKEEADKLTKEEVNVVRSDQTAGIPFVAGKEVIRSRMRQEQMNRWKTCKCRQSKTLSELLISRTRELQAISKQKLQEL